jgi:hypothetical protein
MRPSEKGYLVPHAARNIRTRVEAGAVEAFHIRDISAVEGDAEEAGLYVNVRGGGIAGAGKELDLALRRVNGEVDDAPSRLDCRIRDQVGRIGAVHLRFLDAHLNCIRPVVADLEIDAPGPGVRAVADEGHVSSLHGVLAKSRICHRCK